MGIVLLGYRGSGKTTIGRKLADRLWWKFVDVDERVVARAGKSIKDVFEQDGEGRFRDLEAECVKEALALDEYVISLGGGAVIRPETRELLKASSHKRVYLRCEPKVLHDRIHADAATAANRPALTHLGGGIDEITALLKQREPWYREVMTSEVEVTHLSPDEAVVYIVRGL